MHIPNSQSLTLLLDIPHKEFALSEAAFRAVVEQCGLPAFLTKSLYRYIITTSQDTSGIQFRHFARFWKELKSRNHSLHSLCFEIIAQGKQFIEYEDVCLLMLGTSFLWEISAFISLDVIETHPGLEFLFDYPIFQQRYSESFLTL